MNSKPEKGSALPKFGEWDEKGPSSAEGYTRIFDRVREDKQSGLGQQPDTVNNSVNPSYTKQFDSYQPSVCYLGSIFLEFFSIILLEQQTIVRSGQNQLVKVLILLVRYPYLT